jgi:hypothetical protein
MERQQEGFEDWKVLFTMGDTLLFLLGNKNNPGERVTF